MRPASVNMPPTIDLADPKPSLSWGKRAVRILICLTQIIIALLLLAIIIVITVSSSRTPFIWYLLPLVVVTLLIEICHLRHRPIPPRISTNLGGMKRLVIRAFVYQAAATVGLVFGNAQPWRMRWSGPGGYCYGHYDGLLVAVRIMAWVVWGLGVALFILALIAGECNFEDWLEPTEDEEVRAIHLGDSDSENGDLIGTRGGRHI